MSVKNVIISRYSTVSVKILIFLDTARHRKTQKLQLGPLASKLENNRTHLQVVNGLPTRKKLSCLACSSWDHNLYGDCTWGCALASPLPDFNQRYNQTLPARRPRHSLRCRPRDVVYWNNNRIRREKSSTCVGCIYELVGNVEIINQVISSSCPGWPGGMRRQLRAGPVSLSRLTNRLCRRNPKCFAKFIWGLFWCIF